ncbi:metallophosphoesterase family protein [Roseovarius indicus]|uniref:Phosphodiesterase n=1 Tax=Roseovarius indicus TaxID=540747 RepID=A0A0T5P831_9RHOB|nr:metallophosphoesterase family protein [Roseovarius indicus]KRS17334.1 phosphodiesterase [Roseovarius indicus]QEW26504.1 phosphodiesterase YaeI [Roseovarius indicus]SFD64273.1 3',5'-cyclic AMP phosphodiesterase CpdA [Roseovarius indicus]
MRRIAHLSDLHFGRDRPELLDPLVEAVNELEPDLAAISGDLTQRARPSQFRAARDFIDRLEAPVLAVPGNHDVPLHNLFLRFLWPWRQYRKWISPDLEPEFHDSEMIVLGVNTVNPMAHQSGWFTPRALDRVRNAFCNTRGRRARIVVAHHPLEHLPGEKKKLMRGADEAMEELGRLNTDIVLSGHLHSWRADPFAEKPGRNAVLQVHAGTGLSTRLRGQDNDFNLLEIDDGLIDVTRYAAAEGDDSFAMAQTRRFVTRAEGWTVKKGA